MIIKYKLPRDRSARDHTISRSGSSKACWFDFDFVKSSCSYFRKFLRRNLKVLPRLVTQGLKCGWQLIGLLFYSLRFQILACWLWWDKTLKSFSSQLKYKKTLAFLNRGRIMAFSLTKGLCDLIYLLHVLYWRRVYNKSACPLYSIHSGELSLLNSFKFWFMRQKSNWYFIFCTIKDGNCVH